MRFVVLGVAVISMMGGCGGGTGDGGDEGPPAPEGAGNDIAALAEAGSYIHLVAPSIIEKGEPIDLKLRVVTQLGLPDYDFEGAFRIDATSPHVQFPKNKMMEPQKEGYFQLSGLILNETGVQRLRGSVPGDTVQALANPVYVTEDPEYQIWWGDLNGHSDLSSGARAPGLYYWYGKSVALVDFLALTDNDALEGEDKSLDDAAFRDLAQVCDDENDPGRFVTLLGMEWSSREYGNRLVYFSERPSSLPSAARGIDTPEKLAEALPPGSIVAVPHPSGSEMAPPADPALVGTGGERLVEVYSSVGAFDREGSHRATTRETPGAFVGDLLARGFRPGFIASSDTKMSTPGYSRNPTTQDQRWPNGLTAVLARELTREAILEALRERRCYATTGPRFLLEFTVDGRQMGSEIRVPAGHRAEAYGSLGSTSDWVRAEIVGPNGALATFTATAEESDVIELTATTEPITEPTFVFFHGVDQSGAMAWASPVYLIPE